MTAEELAADGGGEDTDVGFAEGGAEKDTDPDDLAAEDTDPDGLADDGEAGVELWLGVVAETPTAACGFETLPEHPAAAKTTAAPTKPNPRIATPRW